MSHLIAGQQQNNNNSFDPKSVVVPGLNLNATMPNTDKNKTMQIKSLQKLAQNYLNNATVRHPNQTQSLLPGQVTANNAQQRKPVASTATKKQNSNFSSIIKNNNRPGQVDDNIQATSPFDLQGAANNSPIRRAKTARAQNTSHSPALGAVRAKGIDQVRAAQVIKISQQLNSGDFKSSQTEMKGIIKRLNKPEMLLLNHLQNQIKYYYPKKMNKYLNIEQSEQLQQQQQQQVFGQKQ